MANTTDELIKINSLIGKLALPRGLCELNKINVPPIEPTQVALGLRGMRRKTNPPDFIRRHTSPRQLFRSQLA